MADLSGGYTFADGSGAITAARLNALIGSATILPAFITGKSSITPDVADSIVFYDTSGTVLGKCTITALITAMQGTSSGKLAAGNDSRFSASVTGLRLGAGAGADTAAKAKDLAFAPTAAPPTAGAVTLNCALNNLFTTTFVANTTVTLTNVSDGDEICYQITQGGVGSMLLTALVTTQTLWYEGNSAYTLSTAAGSVDLLFFKRIGNQLLTWIKKDFGP
jgi:hypothetical protein